MMEQKIAFLALSISLAAHALLFGALGGVADFSSRGRPTEPKISALNFGKKPYAVLPQIKIIGELSRLEGQKEKNGAENNPAISREPEISAAAKTSGLTDANRPAQEAMLRYQDAVRQKIESCRRYPLWARERNIEGDVGLKFSIFARGNTGAIEITHSSGADILDREALDTIKRASPFPAFPGKITQESVNIRVSLVFSLNGQ